MTTPQTFNIKGMHCASCAAIIEKTLKKVDGVHDVAVNYGTETAKIDFDEAKTNPHHLSQTIEPLGYTIAAAHAPTAASMGMSEDEHAAHLGLNQSKTEKLAEVAGRGGARVGGLARGRKWRGRVFFLIGRRGWGWPRSPRRSPPRSSSLRRLPQRTCSLSS